MKTFQDGDPLFGAMMHAIANLWPNGTAVLSGCAPTGSGSARRVTVAAGTVVVNGAVVSVSQQTKTLDAASFDRYDLVSVNTSGAVIVTKGVDARRVPPVPANSVPIAICLVESGATTLPADRIYDARMDALRVSALTIDADKNWNGKTITNVGSVYAGKVSAKIIPEIIASDEVRASSPATVTGPAAATYIKVKEITIGEVYGSENSVRVKFNARTYFNPSFSGHAYARVYVNGVAKSDELAITSIDSAPFSVDVTGIKTGDKVQLYLRGNGSQMGVVDGFNVCYDLVDVALLPATTATL